MEKIIMIQINFETDDWGCFSEKEVVAIPRIGESVKLGGSWYIVTDVQYVIADAYSKASITVFAKSKRND